ATKNRVSRRSLPRSRRTLAAAAALSAATVFASRAMGARLTRGTTEAEELLCLPFMVNSRVTAAPSLRAPSTLRQSWNRGRGEKVSAAFDFTRPLSRFGHDLSRPWSLSGCRSGVVAWQDRPAPQLPGPRSQARKLPARQLALDEGVCS